MVKAINIPILVSILILVKSQQEILGKTSLFNSLC